MRHIPMTKITDIWFRSTATLMEIGAQLGLEQIEHDAENVWEWITGVVEQRQIDITRAHGAPPAETDTRIFLLGGARVFSLPLIDALLPRLRPLAIGPISLGQWVYMGGDEFEQVVVSRELGTMSATIWMDFSGAPPLLLPLSALPLWRGFYVEHSGAGADLLVDAGAYVIKDDFDFAQPASDYERLCAWQLDPAHQGIQPYPLAPAQLGIAIADGSDGTVGWNGPQRLITTQSRVDLDEEQLAALSWARAFEYEAAEPLLLLNACLFGSDPDLPADQFCTVDLAPGRYAVEWASYRAGYVAELYRFVLIGDADAA